MGMKIGQQGLFRQLCLAGGMFALLLVAACVPPVTYYSVGGSVSGLAAGQSVSVRLSAAGQQQDLTLVFNDSFAFPVQVAAKAGYTVTVIDSPPARECLISNSSGAVNHNIQNIDLVCQDIAIADTANYIPDAQLASCIIDAAAAANPEILYFAELTELTCPGATYPIVSAAGIGHLGKLTRLNIVNTADLVDVDLRKLKELRYLHLALDELVGTIDLSGNVALEVLNLQFNYLTSINLDANTALQEVIINFNCWDTGTLTYLSGLDYPTYQYDTPQNSTCP